MGGECISLPPRSTHHAQDKFEVAVDNVLGAWGQLSQLRSISSLTDVCELDTSVTDELEGLGGVLLSDSSTHPVAHLSLLDTHDRLAGVPTQAGLRHNFLSSVVRRGESSVAARTRSCCQRNPSHSLT